MLSTLGSVPVENKEGMLKKYQEMQKNTKNSNLII